MKIAVTDTGKLEKQKLYMDWLRNFSKTAELNIFSYKDSQHDLSDFDGLVLTGGEDVDPALSKAVPNDLVEPFNRKRDDFEFRMLDSAMSNRIPILGICRGLQISNVFFGGTLIADLRYAGYQHHTAQKNDPELRHGITVREGSLLQTVTGSIGGEVNSYHHQSVHDVADDLFTAGWSSDNVIESLEWKEKTKTPFLLLVQWHPERMKDRSNPFTKELGTTFFSEVQKNINNK